MKTSKKKYRLITRSDFDGLVCAVLLKELSLIDEVVFAHPKDMQDGLVEVSKNDISTNLPYNEKVYLSFDHHLSESIRNKKGKKNHIILPDAKSAARVVFEYYNCREVLGNRYEELMMAVDKADSAEFTIEEILHPQDWVLLSFIMDSRTGLGRFQNFKITNFRLLMDLIEYCRKFSIDEIMNIPDVKERADLYREMTGKFEEQIKECSIRYQNLVVLDMRREKVLYPGNRFIIYALFPECNISIYVLQGHNNKNTVLAVGKSILNKTSKTNVGELMLKYGGGGHLNAGTCQVEHDKADLILKELIEQINKDG